MLSVRIARALNFDAMRLRGRDRELGGRLDEVGSASASPRIIRTSRSPVVPVRCTWVAGRGRLHDP